MLLKEKIISFLDKLAGTKKIVKIIPVDFKKPWWTIIVAQKWYLLFVLFVMMISEVFKTTFPLIINYIIETTSIGLLFLLVAVWLIIVVLEYYKKFYNGILFSQCIQSVHFYAHRFFLLVDPIYHTYRVSGTILGKITRTAYAYEDLIDSLEDIIPTIIDVLTVIISISIYDYHLGALIGGLLLLLALSSSFCLTWASIQYENIVNKADDELKGVSVENLQQIALIRSVFSSCEISKKLDEKHKHMMEAETTLWASYAIIRAFFYCLYILILTLLAYYIIRHIQIGTMTVLTGSSLILTYIRGTGEILKLSSPIRYSIRAYTRITDFYDFIKRFGRQTYPVLKSDITIQTNMEQVKSENYIKIAAESLHFDYFSGARIFDDHSLELIANKNTKNKLYGIIGPSGAGKTTFISILGGQLKPNQGIVKINDIDIYALTDAERRRLIALQGQLASSLRGTLKYNLLFGLDADIACYPNDLLISLLESVGLWQIFKKKNGLDTLIGEGGLNLSGGQRQRLNFASLYLRAQFFKPLLILIDEPTSSLDEISERAITNMIKELSENAITLVIAHRIKTLEDAAGLLDFSLLATEKKMCFYVHDDLIKKSIYYQKLIHGDVSIED